MSTFDFRVNLYSTSLVTDVSSAVLQNGNIAVTYTSNATAIESGASTAIVLKILDQYGNIVKNVSRVNFHTPDDQIDSKVSALEDGGFVVVWRSELQDGSGPGIFSQRFSDNGSKVGPEVLVNTTVAGSQYDPDVTGLDDGGYIVTWTSFDINNDVYLQRYNALGYKVGGETLVNQATSDSQHGSSVSALSDGGYVVAFSSNGGGLNSIILSRFDASGAHVGPDIHVTSSAAFQFLNPDVSTLNNGDFVVTWYDNTNGGVYARIYDQNGTPSGAEFQVSNPLDNPGTGYQSITVLANGDFVVTWSNFVSDEKLAQRYSSDGTPIGDISQVMGFHDLRNEEGAIVGLDDGGFMVLQGSFSTSGDNVFAAIHGQGTDFADYETFTSAADYRGRAGNDLLFGSTDNDILRGGAGIDVLHGNAGNDVLRLGIGNLPGVEIAYGGGGQDVLIDGSGSSKLFGGGGSDLLRGGAHDDSLYGGAGGDFLTGGAGDDLLEGDDGEDVLTGGDNDDALFGGGNKDTLLANSGNDDLYGGAGADVLKGSTGEDNLFGGNGQDKIDGGADDDALTGGAGNDTFIFSNVTFGFDVITDFEDGSDIIRITAGSLTFADVSITDMGENAHVQFGNGEVIVLDAAGLLTVDDFSF